MNHEVILKLQTRPLRLVYLVNTTADLTNAVELYTHLLGGFSNAIFPVPNTDSELKVLQESLYSINPDHIFLPEENLSSDINETLSQLPCRWLRLSSSRIKDIVNMEDQLLCFPVPKVNGGSTQEFPHIIRALNSIYKEPPSNSNFCLISDDSIINSENYLQFGKPSIRYQNYLKNYLNAQSISINSMEALLKISLLGALGVFKSSISITKSNIISTAYGDRQDHYEVLNLFLYQSGDLDIATSFWNSRRFDIGYSNKLILPKEDFVKRLKEYISLLSSFLPSMREIRVHVKLSNNEAVVLANSIYNIFIEIGHNILLNLFHQNFGFDFQLGKIHFSKPVITTREISSLDKSIRFSPEVPSGYMNSNYLFGYDAEIEFSSGRSISMPFTQSSAILLSNPIEQIEYSENAKGNSASYLSKDVNLRKTQPVRPSSKGVTGLAVSNEECRIYFPESKEIITRWLKDTGFSFEINDHTRYAKGFIKRFGGFDKTRNLINSGGSKIFTALSCSRSQQSGAKYSQIERFLKDKFNLINSKEIINKNLPELLKTGLVYRGYPLKCSSCGLEDWYKLEKVNEFVECAGCAEQFQLSDLKSLEFTYKPNELASRFLSTDGQAILSTAVFLSWMASSGHIELGGDLKKIGEKQSFAEIDLFILVKDILILAECKSCSVLNENKAKEIIEHLERVVQIAILVNAKVVILGVATHDEYDFQPYAESVIEAAYTQGIGVHLLINNRFYILGKSESGYLVTNAWQLHVEDLLVQEELSDNHIPISVGEPINAYSWGMPNNLFNRNLLEFWKQELI